MSITQATQKKWALLKQLLAAVNPRGRRHARYHGWQTLLHLYRSNVDATLHRYDSELASATDSAPPLLCIALTLQEQ